MSIQSLSSRQKEGAKKNNRQGPGHQAYGTGKAVKKKNSEAQQLPQNYRMERTSPSTTTLKNDEGPQIMGQPRDSVGIRVCIPYPKNQVRNQGSPAKYGSPSKMSVKDYTAENNQSLLLHS